MPKNLPIQYRECVLDRRAIDEKKRELSLSFSSEEPCPRSFGMEILDHNPESVDLSFLNNGGAVLREHDRNQQIGVVVRASVDADRRGRAVVRFSKSARAEEEFQDLIDGIRQLVSVGYSVDDMEREGQTSDGEPIYRVTKWAPREISIVSVPADVTVGVGRSDLATINRTNTMNPTVTEKNTREDRELTITQERGRIAEITCLGERLDMKEAADEAIGKGMSISAFRKYALDNTSVFKSQSQCIVTETGGLDIGRKDLSRYSFARAILCAADRTFDGLEGELHKEVIRKTGRASGGILVPYEVLSSRGLLAGSFPAAGATVPEMMLSFIGILRNKMFTVELGATVLSGLNGNVTIPRQTGTSTAYWKGEGVAVAASSQTFEQVGMTPNTVTGLCEYSKELLVQSSLDIENFVRSDLAATLAVEIDRAAIAGSGASGEPLGIIGTENINSTVTFGGAAEWSDVVQFETGVAVDNADAGRLAYLSTPATKGKWKTKLKDSVAGANYLWEAGDMVNGYPARATNQVPGDRVIFANWADLFIAYWGALDLVVDPYSKAEQRLVRIVESMFVDVALRRPVSFNVSTDGGAQ